MITLTLPWPVSSNAYWRSFVPRGASRPVVTLSAEAKAYKATVARMARIAGITTPLAGRIALTVALYPGLPKDAAKRMRVDPTGWDDTVRSIDLDNALKVLIDAIKGVVIEDDKWVRRIVAERFEPDGEARVVVHVEPIAASSPQLAIDVPLVPKVSGSAAPSEWDDPWKSTRLVEPFLEPVR